MPIEDKTAAVKRFLANESEYAEAEEISRYLKNNTAELDAIDLFDNLADEEIIHVSETYKKRVLQKTLGQKPAIVRLMYQSLVAASVAAIVFCAGWYLTFNRPLTKTAIVKVAPIKVRNNTKALKRYVLPDGSVVLLKPEAEIVYQPDFTDHRNIEVQFGEAYFKVYKNRAKPFVVAVKGINVTAIGTEFWAQNFRDQSIVSIALTRGKVRINPKTKGFKMDTVFLNPGFRCLINIKTGKVVVDALNKQNDLKRAAVKPGNVASNIKWTNSEIEFSNTPIKSVLKMLENRYHVKFEGDVPALKGYLTGKIYYTDSLNTVINSICELNNMRYERKEDTIFLKKKN